MTKNDDVLLLDFWVEAFFVPAEFNSKLLFTVTGAILLL